MFLNIYTQLQHALTRLISFKIIDKANSKSDLKIKEALHISSRKPNLNMPQNHLALTIAFVPLVVFYLCFFFVSFSSIIFMTLIMGICYCLNYTLLLPHYNTPYTTPFSFLYCFHYLQLIISIFYCLNSISLLLHPIIRCLVNIFYNNYIISISPRQLL